MSEAEKRTFVKELCDRIKYDILNNIALGKIPEEWDGFELRQLVADSCQNSHFAMKGKRKRNYNNAILVNNL
jgi:hypothetical protein